MADTHVTSGMITLGSGGATIGSVNINGSVAVLTSGQTIGTSISGNSISVSNFPTTSISGNVVNISGAQVQTSVSGNVVQAMNTIGSQIIAGTVIVPSNSGGVQLPSNPLSVGMIFAQNIQISGNPFANISNIIFVGGLGNNAPYYDTTVSPAFNGLIFNGSPLNSPEGFQLSVNNTNTVRVVAASGFSGVALNYMGF